jgi:transposase
VDAATEPDRRPPRGPNPNSRSNAPPRRRSSHPQDREVTVQHGTPKDAAPLTDAALPVAGVDVSKDKLDLFVDAAGRRLCVANGDAGFAALAAELLRHRARLVVVEATGRYHRRLAAALLDAGLAVAVVNPAHVRDFARAAGRLEKDDRIDAEVLAHFGRAMGPRVAERAPAERATLADLVSRRRGLVQARVAEANRAREQAAPLARRQSARLLRLLDQQVEDLDREIARLVEADGESGRKARIVDSVPGVGPGTANQLVAELPELGRLNRQEVAKLAGLAPLKRDSGRFRGQRRIGGGRKGVRDCLYMAAFNARQKCGRFRRYFEALIARGKPYQVAMTACMRKLLVTFNRMVQTDTHWHDTLHGELA